MAWYVSLAHFGAGIFLANGVPHFVHGISGSKFQSPFASPPGVGESSALVNVVWGMANFLIGWLLLSVGDTTSPFAFGLGVFLISVGLAWHFGRVRSK